jgi:tetratricopeptide (TPR) repeat protein
MLSLALGLSLLLAAAPDPAAVIVFPPEPQGGAEPWIGEAVAEQLPRSLEQLGAPALARADRLRGQAALEIPAVTVTRATAIRLAEAVGAGRVVTGTYALEEGTLALTLRVLDTARAALGEPLVAKGALETLPALVDTLAFEVARTGPFPPTQERSTFLSQRGDVPFEAYRAHALSLVGRNVATRARLARRAITLAPAFHAARLTLARLQIEEREWSAAYETLARVPPTSPLWRTARFLQGIALLEIGRYREAAALYAHLAQTGATPAVLNNEGLALLRDGDRATRGSEPLRRAAESAGATPDIAFNLAWTLIAEGEAEAAVPVLEGILRDAPLDKHARVVLAWALKRAGRAADHEREWRAVVALAPTYVTMVEPDLSRRFERILPSERLFRPERGPRDEGEVAAALLARAEKLFAGGDVDGALQEANRASYLDPYSLRVHLLLARVHRARGDREQALNEFRMALWSRDDAGVRVEVASLLGEMGRADEAKVEAGKALQLDPANEAARRIRDGN